MNDIKTTAKNLRLLAEHISKLKESELDMQVWFRHSFIWNAYTKKDGVVKMSAGVEPKSSLAHATTHPLMPVKSSHFSVEAGFNDDREGFDLDSYEDFYFPALKDADGERTRNFYKAFGWWPEKNDPQSRADLLSQIADELEVTE